MQIIESSFLIQYIPNSDTLYMRVHKINLNLDEIDEKQKIKLAAFDPKPEGSSELSTDWNKYSSAVETQHRAKIPSIMVYSLLMFKILEINLSRLKFDTILFHSQNILKKIDLMR